MHELTEEQRDERLAADERAAIGESLPPVEEDVDDALDEEAVIRERLRQIRLDSAHIPVAHEPPPGVFSRIRGLFRR